MFASMGKQATATSPDEARAKAEASKLSVPGKQIWGTSKKRYGFLVEYQNGGKRRKTARGRKTRRNKTRRSRGKKIGFFGF
jgi:hypothetical protein